MSISHQNHVVLHQKQRIAELEAERDEYKAALQNIVMVYTVPKAAMSLADVIEAGKRLLMDKASR